MDFSRLPRVEALKKARYRTREPGEVTKRIQEEIRYLNNHPEDSSRVQKLEDRPFLEWYKHTRGILLRVAREMGIPITVRQEEGNTGLVFWKATEEELATRPNPRRRPTPEQKAMGVTEDLEEGADEDEIEEVTEEETEEPERATGRGSRRKRS